MVFQFLPPYLASTCQSMTILKQKCNRRMTTMTWSRSFSRSDTPSLPPLRCGRRIPIASRIPPDRDSYSVLKLVRHFCCSEVLGPLRMFWGPFGAASWGLLDSFWGFLGSSWSLLGGSGGPLGATWGPLGEVLGPLGMVLGLMLQQVIF